LTLIHGIWWQPGYKRRISAGGVEENDCRQMNEAFIHRILYHQPFGILKYAMTLDGKLPPVVTVPGSQTKLPERGASAALCL